MPRKAPNVEEQAGKSINGYTDGMYNFHLHRFPAKEISGSDELKS